MLDKNWLSQVKIKRGGYALPLLGPINFTNHGCVTHSNIKIDKKDLDKNIFPCEFYEDETKKVTEIQKGDELLWPYG